MSPSYPVLNNRPIDQWKVTELKEELKRRKLTTKGLKDDLIRRLAEALGIESENAANEDNDLIGDPQPADEAKVVEPRAVLLRTPRSTGSGGRKRAEKVVIPVQVDINDSADALSEGNIEEGYVLVDRDAGAIPEEEVVIQSTIVETSVSVTESVVTEVALVGQDSPNIEANKGEDPKPAVENEDPKRSVENEDPKRSVENEDPKPAVENEDPKPAVENEYLKPAVENEDPMPKMENEVPSPQLENEVPIPHLENEVPNPLLGNKDPEPLLENEDSNPQLENEESKPQLENEDPEPPLDNDGPKPQLENEDPNPQLEGEGLEATAKDVKLDSSAPNYQVSEVSSLGYEVKYDSISTDSVSINEKIELKDDIIADHVKLELDVIKTEMLDPSSSTIVPVGGDSHPMDVEEPLKNKASIGEKDGNNDTNADISKKNESVDMGDSEKLNLERSSGDDSMEEDVLDSKQIDSKYSSDDVIDMGEKNEVPVVKEESHVDIVVDDISTEKKVVNVENKNHTALPSEKRKLNVQAAVLSNEPVKRRRWNSESLKVPKLQSPTQTPTVTPKDTFQSPSLNRSFSRSDSTMSDGTPKERVVPPSNVPPTNSLRIDRFLRPFTLKAVQEFLGKTGKVTDFWMDHIKTHCYVSYPSVEEALETRNAVYNLQWPPNGGRLLVAEFVDPQEVKNRLQVSQTPAAPVSSGPAAPVSTGPAAPVSSGPAAPINSGPAALVAPPTSQPQPSPSPHQPRQQPQQQLPPPPSLPPPPPLSTTPLAREQLPLPPQPPLSEKLETPILTLDDLFRKTKSTPRIYYLPLSEEQVTEKLAAQGRSIKQ